MAQATGSQKTYDVCVIGSGAGGGMAAKILTEGGMSVVLLEAGPPVNPPPGQGLIPSRLRTCNSAPQRCRCIAGTGSRG